MQTLLHGKRNFLHLSLKIFISIKKSENTTSANQIRDNPQAPEINMKMFQLEHGSD